MPLDEVAALHLGRCTNEAFVLFAREFDGKKSSGQPEKVSAAWESVCRFGMDRPEGFLDSEAPAIPLRERLGLLLKHNLAVTDPVHWAVENGPEVLATLVSGPQPLIDVDIPSRATGTTALMKAAHAGKLESVKTLLAHGANPLVGNNSGMTALHCLCVGSADPEITTAILEAAKQKIANRGTPQNKRQEALSNFVNQVDENGDGALKFLFYADSEENSVASAKLLLEAGAKLDARHRTGETVLHFGARTCGTPIGDGEFDARHNNMGLLNFLASQFKDKGLSLDTLDADGYTALFRAAHAGRTQALTALIEQGADWRWAVDKNGEQHSVPRAAVESKNLDAVVGMTRCVFQQNRQDLEQAKAALEEFQQKIAYEAQPFSLLVQLALSSPARQAAS